MVLVESVIVIVGADRVIVMSWRGDAISARSPRLDGSESYRGGSRHHRGRGGDCALWDRQARTS